ncbi:MAG: glycosyltransferase family 39 protein [Planctomycetales bacterium]|nr:glycosyltransferase family 39 protein [Planctomycetales bacterium]
MFASLLSLLTVALMTAAACAVGRRLATALRLSGETPLARLAWNVALGYVAVGTAIAALGLAGGLYPAVIGVPTMALAGVALGDGWKALQSRRNDAAASESDIQPPAPIAPPADWLDAGTMLLAAATVLATLTAALAPPTAGDAMCYHLELPKQYLLAHTIAFSPYHENSTFPLLAEMWYAWALAIDTGVAAQLVAWVWGLLLAAATFTLAAPLVGERWARLAATLALLTPAVSNQMTAPLSDLACASLATLALAAWYRAVVEDRGAQWFVVAGIMLGGAAATKYLGLLFAAALAVDGLWRLARQKTRRRQLVLGGATLVVLAASTAGVWYVRAAWHRGNPVYPFFSAALGGEELGALPERKTPLLASPTAALTAPWQITMHPERFGGRGHRLGPLLLAVLPGLVACRRLRGLGTLLGVAGVFAVGWLLLRQNVRFLLPALPPLCVACAWCVAEWSRWPRAPRVVACAALAAVLGLHTAAAGWRSRDKLAVAVGRETREDYLLRNEPTFRAAATANELYRGGDVIFSQDYRAFYFRAPVVREATYRRQTAYDQQAGDRAAVCAHLVDAGFTHVLLARRCNSAAGDNVANAAHQGIHFNDTLSRLWDTAPLESERPAALDVAPQLLIDYEVVDSDGALRHYRLVQLPQRRK